jgi:hypothetical protein
MKLFDGGNMFDKVFKKKLSNFELDRPDHLWKGIEEQLEKSASRKLLYGPFLNNLVLIVSLLATSAIGAYYLYNSYYNNAESKTEIINDQKTLNDQASLLLNNSKSNGYTASSDFNSESLVNGSSNDLKKDNSKDSSHGLSAIVQKSTTQKNHQKSSFNNLEMREANSNESDQFSEANLFMTGTSNVLNSNILSNDGLNEGNLNSLVLPLNSIAPRALFVNYEENSYTPRSSKRDAVEGCALKRPEKSKYFIDAYYQPEVMSNSIKAFDSSYANYAAERSNSESFVMSNSFGFRASLVLPSGVSFRTGLNISKAEERFDYVKERQEIMIIIKDKNNVPIDTITEFKIITEKRYNKYEFYDVPLVVGYEVNLKDFILTVNGGLGLNVAFNQKGEIYSPDLSGKYNLSGGNSTDGVYKVFRSKAGVSVLGSFGLNYKISSRWSLIAEPSFRYYIKSLSDPSYPLAQNFGSFGLMAGLRYRIK